MPDRETLEVDVLIVGGGPAGVSAALRLNARQQASGGTPLTVAIVEKSKEPGAHVLSGAVLDPSALAELVPDFAARGAPVSCAVTDESIYALTERSSLRSPFVPPSLRNHGNFVISVNALVKWLMAQAQIAGTDIFTGFAARDVIFDGLAVRGVRTGDRGLNRQGEPTAAFEPGVDIRAKVTIFCDGVRGNLTKMLVERLKLDAGRLPQVYALGIKELWELPPGRVRPGTVWHTLGYPLKVEEFGGGFLYGMADGTVSLGLVTGLSYRDPLFDPYLAFQRFKLHPLIRGVLAGGHVIRYGAKALPEGGWYTVPKVSMDGALIAGDAGGFLNSLRLKGLHLAMRTGMLAADAAFDAIRAGDTSAAALARYEAAIAASAVKRELYPARNAHQAFEHGLVAGVAFAGLSLVTGGAWIEEPMSGVAGYARLQRVDEYYGRGSVRPPTPVPIDRVFTFDRPTSVHASGTRHREDEPSHLLVHDTDICRTRCRAEFGNPCTRFCPAEVYEMMDDGAGGVRLHVQASNCVHCKACDIMDPYQIIDWVPPEGGEGPQYNGM